MIHSLISPVERLIVPQGLYEFFADPYGRGGHRGRLLALQSPEEGVMGPKQESLRHLSRFP